MTFDTIDTYDTVVACLNAVQHSVHHRVQSILSSTMSRAFCRAFCSALQLWLVHDFGHTLTGHRDVSFIQSQSCQISSTATSQRISPQDCALFPSEKISGRWAAVFVWDQHDWYWLIKQHEHGSTSAKLLRRKAWQKFWSWALRRLTRLTPQASRHGKTCRSV